MALSQSPKRPNSGVEVGTGSFTDELRALRRHLVLIKVIFFSSVFLSRLKKRFECNRILE